MAITVVSVSDSLLLELNDVGGTFFTADRALDLVLGATDGTETTWQFQRIQAGYYALQSARKSRLALLTTSAPYTEPSGVTASRFYAGGPTSPNIRVTGGTTSDTQIAVTGVEVDFRELMCTALERVSTHWGLQAQDQHGDVSLALNMLEKVRYMQKQWRGAFSV